MSRGALRAVDEIQGVWDRGESGKRGVWDTRESVLQGCRKSARWRHTVGPTTLNRCSPRASLGGNSRTHAIPFPRGRGKSARAVRRARHACPVGAVECGARPKCVSRTGHVWYSRSDQWVGGGSVENGRTPPPVWRQAGRGSPEAAWFRHGIRGHTRFRPTRL